MPAPSSERQHPEAWPASTYCSATTEVLEAGRATIDLNAFKDTLASGLAAK